MDEIRAVALPYPQWDAKNLFIRDDKKQHYYLISVKGDKRVDLKAFRKAQGLRPLSFASPDDLRAILHLTPGAVTPLGLLNDEARRVHLYVDADFQGHPIRRRYGFRLTTCSPSLQNTGMRRSLSTFDR